MNLNHWFIVVYGVPGLVNDRIAMAGMTSPFLIGNTSTQSGSIFQPAMLDYCSVLENIFVLKYLKFSASPFFQFSPNFNHQPSLKPHRQLTLNEAMQTDQPTFLEISAPHGKEKNPFIWNAQNKLQLTITFDPTFFSWLSIFKLPFRSG